MKSGKNRRTIAFTGGGTAGHVIPGLVVADAVKAMDNAPDVYWIGSKRSQEIVIVRDHGIRFYRIETGKLRRYFSLKNALDIARIIIGTLQAFFLLLKARPSLLFSKGGFVSVPPVLAAKILGIPVLTHESDLVPGLATRINTRFADKILISFTESIRFFGPAYKDRVVFTGNPVRREIVDAAVSSSVKAGTGRPYILVLGGSQGCREINKLVLAVKNDLLNLADIVHQAGPAAEMLVESPGYRSFGFIGKELPVFMTDATLVISRAGANTLNELACLGKAVILIPLGLGASRGDQIQNAEYLEKKEACVVLKSPDPAMFLQAVVNILHDDLLRKRMEKNIKSLYNPDTVQRILTLIRSFL